MCTQFLDSQNIDFDDNVIVPLELPLKMSLSENENKVNLKSASFIVIMLLYESLTHIHSQKKPRLHFCQSFTLVCIIFSLRCALIIIPYAAQSYIQFSNPLSISPSQAEIVKRLSAICAQIIPFLSQEVSITTARHT